MHMNIQNRNVYHRKWLWQYDNMTMTLCVCVCVVCVCWKAWRWHAGGWRNEQGWMFTSTYWAYDEQLSFITADCQPLTLSLFLLPLLTLRFFTLTPISNSLTFPRCPSAIGMKLSFCQTSISLSIHRSLPDHGQMLACQFLCFLPHWIPKPVSSVPLTCSSALSSFGREVNNLF